MNYLPYVLKKEKYKKVKFKLSKTQHLLIKAKINGVKGNFILDTGASSSCVGFESIKLFRLKAKKSDKKAAGAGAVGMLTETAIGNHLKVGNWTSQDFNLIIFDLSHVNEALLAYNAKPVHGIIGADVLMKGKGIIDYYNHCLYLL
jgi:predicted aspartyl protease